MTTQETEAARKEAAIKKKDEGNAAFKEHRYNKAILLYTESLRLVPNHLVYGNRAQTYIHLQKYELALRDLNEALEIEPEFIKNIHRRSKVLSHLGMNTEARLDNAAILRRTPKDKNALAEAETLKGKENARYTDVKQWNSGAEFEEDEMVAIPIEGLDPPSTVFDTVAAATVLAAPVADPTTNEDTVSTVAPTPIEDTARLSATEAAEFAVSNFSGENVKDESFSSISDLHSTDEEMKEDEQEDAVAQSQKSTVIPPPAKNMLDFYMHFKLLKHDSKAFGEYFLSIDPSSISSIFSNLLQDDHLKTIVAGLTEAARNDLADLSLISSSLLAVSSLPRFDILVLFMKDDDRAKALSLIDLLPSTEERELIRKNFQ